MKVIHRKKTSKCTDGNTVSEFTLSDPIDSAFLSVLDMVGSLSIKNLGDLQMFTFQEEDWLTLKGMSGDTILYVTHPKTDKKRAEERIDTFMKQYSEVTG